MKAAILRAAKTRMSIEDVELDGPRPQEVRIRVAASGLCHSDYHVISGRIGMTFPIVLGHEASGVVEAVGDEVRDLVPGDRVVSLSKLYMDGRLLLDPLISERITLAEIDRGYEKMIAGNIARSVICFDP